MKVVTRTEISACPLISRGKVRDIYSVDDNSLLIVTTDRMLINRTCAVISVK